MISDRYRHFGRRTFLLAGAAAVLAGCAPAPASPTPSKSPTSKSPTSKSPTPEPRASETPSPEPSPLPLDLGDLPPGSYSVWGSMNGRVVAHQPATRIRMCSTMKLPLVALALREQEHGRIDLQSPLSWEAADLIGHSPFTRDDPDHTATIAELCEATARSSDNTAANLLIDAVGGLPALTGFARSLGDDVTRFDRYETVMNTRDGDLDTTTAEAFGRLALSLFQSLGDAQRDPLLSWLPARDERRIAAAAPPGIELSHKTGTSGDGVLNDVALLFANGEVAGALAVFTDSPSASEEVVVEIARRAFTALGV